MHVTLAGIVTSVSPLQLLNAEAPIRVTPSGIVTSVSPLQPLNAESPMPRIPVRSKLPERDLEHSPTHPSTSFTPKIVLVSKSEPLQP